MNDILIKGGTLVPLGGDSRIIRKGGVLVDGNRIKDFGKYRKLEKRYDFKRSINASDKIIMPGFINTHNHFYSTLARGLSMPGESPRSFEDILKNFWWKLDKNLTKESIYYSTLIYLLECVKSGTTTVIDHHESQSFQRGSLDKIAEAVEEVGLRATLCLGASDRYNKGKEGLKENERFLSRLDSDPSDLLKGMIGLHASFTVENETLKRAVELADDFDVGIHFHCAEGKVDQEKNLEKYDRRVVERLHEHGVLGKKSIAVHGIHLNDHELDLLSKTDTKVVHNPESNMKNAVGYADVLKMSEGGITVGLGTDGMSSNMLSQMRCAYLLQPHQKRDPRIGFTEAQKILLDNNPRIVEEISGWNVGKISKGALADIVLLNYHPPTPFNSNTFPGHLIYGLVDSEVDTVICNGEIIMENGSISKMDEKRISEKASEVASEIWNRVK